MKIESKTKTKKYGDQICDRDNILDQMSGHYRYHLICPLPYNPPLLPPPLCDQWFRELNTHPRDNHRRLIVLDTDYTWSKQRDD